MRRLFRPPVLLVAAGAALTAVAQARAATELGPGLKGVPALWNTIDGPEGQGAPLRFGLFWQMSTVDPAFGFEAPVLTPDASSRALHLQAMVRPARAVALGVDIPYRWTSVDNGASHSGLGDLEATLNTRWLATRRARLGAWASVRLPTGKVSEGLSTDQTEGEFGLHGTWIFFPDSAAPEMRWHFNVGYRVNKNEDAGYGVLDSLAPDPGATGIFPPYYPPAPDSPGDNDEVLLRTALEFRRRWVHLFVEGSLDWLSAAPGIELGEMAAWVTPGLYAGRDDGVGLKLAWSIGLHADDVRTAYRPTLPDWVLTAGLSYPIFLGGRDRDDDGVPDARDQCPDVPEDIDGTQDQDGCPDLDNDGDGIPDRQDAAPNLSEDFDGFQDEDGRPDLDNDLDGIQDQDDQCPLKPEDFDGFEDTDGCPDVVVDRDSDGVEDAADACPDVAEDRDGFEDQDGCPDLDNDLDGIPDTRDQCPDAREDYDGVSDDDGCPDEG